MDVKFEREKKKGDCPGVGYINKGDPHNYFQNVLNYTASRLPVFPGYNGGLSRSSLVLPLIPWEPMVENGRISFGVYSSQGSFHLDASPNQLPIP